MSDFANRIRTALYRIWYQWLLRCAHFGSRAVISCRLEIKGPGRVLIGNDVRIESGPWSEEFVTIFTHHPSARVVIGHRARLRGTRIGCRESISVGDGAIVDEASLFDTDFHSPIRDDRDAREAIKTKAIEIGSDVRIGSECLCGKGSQIGDRARVLPGTVLSTRNVLPGTTLIGNPPRQLPSNRSR